MSASSVSDSYVTGNLARPRAAATPAPSPVVDATAVARWLPAVVLTLLDAALTYTWISLGVAAEGNPWLAGLIETSGPGPAMAVRVGVGLALVGSLAFLAHRHASARKGLWFVTAALGLVVCWHVVGSVTIAFA